MLAQGYGANLPRVLVGLAVGALGTGFLVALWSLWGEVLAFGVRFVLDYRLRPSLAALTIALVVWTAGLIVLGTPFWWLLHKLGSRHLADRGERPESG